jgi:predicted nuclease of predicted toxin-antitoxin system
LFLLRGATRTTGITVGSVKLLLDQNLSRRLLPELEVFFPGSVQVALCGLDKAADSALWDFARAHGFAIVTKDSDFLELALLRGFPPKVVLLNLGNASNQRVREVLLKQAAAISEFLELASQGVLEID